jgi:acetyltransferase
MPQSHELILGIFNDKIFGPIILFGAGGKAVEELSDKALDLPPLTHKIASNMIKSTRIYKLLKGYRDEPAANLEKIEECLIRLSLLARDFPEIVELDINPLLADAERVIAVDGRIKVQKYEGTRDHLVL